jgi:S-adenosylmethionine hydrolase
VTLTTDFGLTDSYVAEMKGRILGLCPDAVLVDISHQVPPGDIAAGAFILGRAAGAFPPGTVHLAVVDPGVGGSRPALAAATPDGFAVGPDNGLLAPLLAKARLVRLAMDPQATPPASATFHGRDLFAPAAARLAAGTPLEQLGEPLDTYRQLPARGAACSVLHVDHFGNCVTDIDPEEVPAGGDWQVLAGSHTITRRVTAYHEAATDEPVLLKGSDGRMEFAIRDGRAAATLQLAVGQPLTVENKLSSPPRREKIR